MAKELVCAMSTALLLMAATATTVEWVPCPPVPKDFLVQPKTSSPFQPPVHVHHMRGSRNFANHTTSCVNLTVPLDWSAGTNGPTIPLFITRIPAYENKVRKGSLWLLNGGPGADGEDLLPFATTMHDLLGGNYDIVMPDHRGTGFSSSLFCPNNHVANCVAYLKTLWGDKLHHFSTEGAAYDVRYAIDVTRASPNEEVYVWGGSYGSYWLNHYAQVAPTQPTAIHFDGFCPSGVCHVQWYDHLSQNGAGMDFMAMCDRNLMCAGHFGSALKWTHEATSLPSQKLLRVLSDIRAGKHSCAARANITIKKLNSLFASLNMAFDTRPLTVATLYRLVRCNSADFTQLLHAFSDKVLANYVADFVIQESGQSSPTAPMNQVLMLNVVLSELMQTTLNSSVPPPTAEDLEADSASLSFATYWPSSVRKYYDEWDRYVPNPKYFGKKAGIDDDAAMPMLITNGDLDPQTSFLWTATTSAAYHARTTGPTHLITVPRSAHCTVQTAPVEGSPYTCGELMLASFIHSHGGEVDTSCVSKVEEIDFSGIKSATQKAANSLFGTDALWGDVTHLVV